MRVERRARHAVGELRERVAPAQALAAGQARVGRAVAQVAHGAGSDSRGAHEPPGGVAERRIHGPLGYGGVRTLITGGAGYIGMELVDELLDSGHEVTVLDVLLHD